MTTKEKANVMNKKNVSLEELKNLKFDENNETEKSLRAICNQMIKRIENV